MKVTVLTVLVDQILLKILFEMINNDIICTHKFSFVYFKRAETEDLKLESWEGKDLLLSLGKWPEFSTFSNKDFLRYGKSEL